jgi:hypothetical protein
MWLYATSRPHLAADGMTPALSRFVAKIHSAPILVYAAAIALAHWYVPLGLILFAAVPAFFILPNPFVDRRLRSAMGAPPLPAGTGMTQEKRFDTTATRL